MDNWLTFWKLLLIGAFSLFAVLTVAVAIGGIFDLRAMFRSVDAQHQTARKDLGPHDDPVQ